jgi:SAM-dependent methyltransferase
MYPRPAGQAARTAHTRKIREVGRAKDLVKYYLWGIGEKTLSYVPFGKRFYSTVGSFVKRNKHGTKPSFQSSLRLAQGAKARLRPGATAMEIGTGWFHHDAFLLYLLGDYTVYLFDIEDKARLRYIHNYVRTLLANVDLLAEALDLDRDHMRTKLEPLLGLESREAIYEHCNFVPSITQDVLAPWLDERSIDFMVSNCVLNHIPPNVLVPELAALRDMLKPDGAMYHLLGHDDHWRFHDRSANMFNYYRYSDRYYRLFFETKLEYHNRMVKQEWLPIFERADLEVLEYYEHITDESREAASTLPHVDERFARYPKEDLAILYSYVLLGPRATDS